MTLGRPLHEHEVDAIRLLDRIYSPRVIAEAIFDAGDAEDHATPAKWLEAVARAAAWRALAMRFGGRHRLD